jgi:glutathione S-transferase
MTQAKLYVIPASHACRTGILLLKQKGIDYKLVTFPSGLHPVLVRLAGFPGSPEPFRRIDGRPTRTLSRLDRLGTVPSLKLDGHKAQTNLEISRFLEELKPEPPLFPANPQMRRAVEEAERWGDEVFQMEARRILVAAGLRSDGLVNHGDDGRLGFLLWRNRTVRRLGLRLVARAFRATPGAEAKLRSELPGMLDRIDTWIGEGVLNCERLNAADLMIAPSLALLSYCRDVRPELERRPLIGLLDRILPEPEPGAAASA